jgi:hypothetical protein
MSSLFMRPVRAIFVCLLPHYETSEYTNIILKYIQPAILDYIANQGYLQVFLSINTTDYFVALPASTFSCTDFGTGSYFSKNME